MKNIALIGMMGCGKSTLAKDLAQKSGLPLFVCDNEIEKEAGKSIPEIFATDGEEAFRSQERQLALKLSSCQGLIIDCGGGFVTRKEHVELLKKSSMLVFVRRPVEEILKTLDSSCRPLAANPKEFATLYAQRLPLYQQVADKTIDNLYLSESLSQLLRIKEELE